MQNKIENVLRNPIQKQQLKSKPALLPAFFSKNLLCNFLFSYQILRHIVFVIQKGISAIHKLNFLIDGILPEFYKTKSG